MSLLYPFTLWIVVEQKGNEVGKLTWLNYISTQDLVPYMACFCAESGR